MHSYAESLLLFVCLVHCSLIRSCIHNMSSPWSWVHTNLHTFLGEGLCWHSAAPIMICTHIFSIRQDNFRLNFVGYDEGVYSSQLDSTTLRYQQQQVSQMSRLLWTTRAAVKWDDKCCVQLRHIDSAYPTQSRPLYLTLRANPFPELACHDSDNGLSVCVCDRIRRCVQAV